MEWSEFWRNWAQGTVVIASAIAVVFGMFAIIGWLVKRKIL